MNTEGGNGRMKKRILIIGLVVVFLLAAFAPTSAFAKGKKKKFKITNGEINYISPGELRYVCPPPTEECLPFDPEDPEKWPFGWYRVVEREIYGNIAKKHNSIYGNAILTYGGMFLVLAPDVYGIFNNSQAGVLKGMLMVTNEDGATYGFDLKGKTEPIDFTGDLDYLPSPPFPPGILVPIYELTLEGTWELLLGGKGQGKFNATAEVLVLEGHVVGLVEETGNFNMTGWWKKDKD